MDVALARLIKLRKCECPGSGANGVSRSILVRFPWFPSEQIGVSLGDPASRLPTIPALKTASTANKRREKRPPRSSECAPPLVHVASPRAPPLQPETGGCDAQFRPDRGGGVGWGEDSGLAPPAKSSPQQRQPPPPPRSDDPASEDDGCRVSEQPGRSASSSGSSNRRLPLMSRTMGAKQTKGQEPGGSSPQHSWKRTPSKERGDLFASLMLRSGDRLGRGGTPPPPLPAPHRDDPGDDADGPAGQAGRGHGDAEDPPAGSLPGFGDLGMESTSLDDVLYRYASFRNLVDPITHDLIISLARYVHCPKTEGDSLGAMEKVCRQLTYHLSPHSRWRRQGLLKRKPQAW
ncbi:unnamed protein product [Menidia menidia]|uniref:(Atlantic silverside) hypothetical protein n=1 Tax=Menidia menidia TaxID=238744 RepID=A0A8S4BR54_9TELE|nr:unnamed protein product [Menidia menidia]